MSDDKIRQAILSGLAKHNPLAALFRGREDNQRADQIMDELKAVLDEQADVEKTEMLPTNYIWHVDRTSDSDHDEYDGVVVIGPDLEWVKYYVTRKNDEGRPVYRGFDDQARNLEITNIGVAYTGSEPGELMASFCAG